MSLKLHNLPSTYFRVSVKALIFNEQNCLLVFRDDKGEYEIPGGGLEHNETTEECLRRELREEVGAQVEQIDERPICIWVDHEPPGYFKLCLAYRVSIGTDKLVPADDNLVAFEYVDRDAFLQLPFQQSEKVALTNVDKIWPAD